MLRAAGVRIPAVHCCDVMYDIRDMLHNMSLPKACSLFGVPLSPPHDALNDCMNTLWLSKVIARVIA